MRAENAAPRAAAHHDANHAAAGSSHDWHHANPASIRSGASRTGTRKRLLRGCAVRQRATQQPQWPGRNRGIGVLRGCAIATSPLC
jgi:hypothetical protein